MLVFAAGTHAAAGAQVALGARESLPHTTVVVMGGAGVIATEGETEGAAAISALALAAPVRIAQAGEPRDPDRDPASLGADLARQLGDGGRGPVVMSVEPQGFRASLLDTFHAVAGTGQVVGGGAAPRGVLAAAEPEEEPRASAALAIQLRGMRLATGVTPGVKKLTPFMRVGAIERGFVTRLDGRGPLDVLTDAVKGRSDRPMVFAVFAARDDAEQRPGHALVRGISGVDPARSGVHVGEEVRVGDRIAFATLDSGAARDDLEAMLRDLGRRTGGGAAIAALYFNCAGRGSALYGAQNVDSRAIRDRLRDVPFAGMQSSFEIAPFDGRPRLHLYSGVLALLFAPS